MPSAKNVCEVSAVWFSIGSTATLSIVLDGSRELNLRQPTHAAASTPNATSTAVPRGGRRRTAAGGRRTVAACDAVSAWTNCAAGLKRSAGFLASVRDSTPTISGGTVGRRLVTGAASVSRCWRVTLSIVGPVNGG